MIPFKFMSLREGGCRRGTSALPHRSRSRNGSHKIVDRSLWGHATAKVVEGPDCDQLPGAGGVDCEVRVDLCETIVMVLARDRVRMITATAGLRFPRA